MKLSGGGALVLPLLLCVGCAGEPQRQVLKSTDESCLFTTDEAISYALTKDMKILDEMRAAAAACTTPTPTIPVPGVPTAKSSYQAWLGSASSGIASGGLGSDYAAVATSAQSLEGFLQSCPGGGLHLPDCGTDVNCQRGQTAALSFAVTGERMVGRFKGCPAAIRQKASDELYSHHSWN
jgi:hypothetical protein